MKILVEMTDEEYQKFRNYKEDIKARMDRETFREERDRLMDLIRREIPDKSLVIVGGGGPANYYLETREKEDDKDEQRITNIVEIID